jgi:hypothetical protein
MHRGVGTTAVSVITRLQDQIRDATSVIRAVIVADDPVLCDCTLDATCLDCSFDLRAVEPSCGGAIPT